MFVSVQVSKTDPSPKREMPTMILFNVVFALRVCKDFLNLESKISTVLLHVCIQQHYYYMMEQLSQLLEGGVSSVNHRAR